ncbi:MAG: outer membrane beta-barrel protein [Verrucomicrobiota bacterium]
MNKFILSLIGAIALTSAAYAGTESYAGKDNEVRQTASSSDWYADREWNLSIWGTYAFTGNEYRKDRYLGVDHAFGAGVDAKYFFTRYLGAGVEGYLLDTHDTAGTILGTLTFRYPLPASRFAPYVFAGGGGIFNGDDDTDFRFTRRGVFRRDEDSKAVGQFGGGFEFRFTPHLGLINDVSWNVIDGSDNNFGMVRTGVNFSF